MTSDDLKSFTRRVAAQFDAGKIRHPVHLSDGNEERLVALFETIRQCDWIFCSWRSHHQCLLKGIHPDTLMGDIESGKSIALCYPEHRIFSSAIVAGNIPIALGVALAIAREKSGEQVFCFLGDMTAETGTFHECHKYSVNFDLPITWVIEDNGKSVCTPTRVAWGNPEPTWYQPRVVRHTFKNMFPHSGAGKHVQF